MSQTRHLGDEMLHIGASSEVKFCDGFWGSKISVGGELQIGRGVLGFNAKLQ